MRFSAAIQQIGLPHPAPEPVQPSNVTPLTSGAAPHPEPAVAAAGEGPLDLDQRVRLSGEW
ncbi:hypothetical protein [Ramlibacter sp.]|uniref:hypothetical protein n=1 Tax=Ramlibacter sp. TaxID=1917967 RepID=UPI002BA0BFED|nr:hypothetical protein [Ramlibacter sp.]HWI81949.1 hypothetical protein [Ramlibacter sp.]